MTYEDLAPFVGERVRLTARNGFQKVGHLTSKDHGRWVDYLIDNIGGFPIESYGTLEIMGENGRYRMV